MLSGLTIRDQPRLHSMYIKFRRSLHQRSLGRGTPSIPASCSSTTGSRADDPTTCMAFMRNTVRHNHRGVYELHAYNLTRLGRAVRVGPDEVDFCDMSALKEIFNVKETFVKSPWYRQMTGSPQDGIFDTTSVEVHRRYRRLLSGPMSETSLKTAIPVIRGRVDLAVRRMKEEMASRGAADVFKWWLFMATDVIGELTFGESFQLLEQGKV